jgi:putative ABC transport system permease protein
MLSLYRTLSLRYWCSRWTRTALVVASIALGVSTWVATGVLDSSLGTACSQAATPLAGAADFHVSNGDAGVQADLAEALARVPGVRTVRPLVIQRITLPDLDHRPALLLGVDLNARPAEAPPWTVQPCDLDPQLYVRALFLGQQPALVGRELDRALGPGATHVNILVAGHEQRLLRTGTLDGRGWAAVLAGNALVIDCARAAELLGRPGLVSRIDLFLDPDADRARVQRLVAQELGGKARLWTPEGHDRRVQELLAGLRTAFALCGAGALVVGLFLVYNVLAVSVAERRHDVGILRSLGATRGQLARLFLGEVLLLGLGGAALGLPLGLGLARLSLGPMRQVLGDMFLPLPLQHLQVSAGAVGGAVAAGLAAALLAALVPTAQAVWDCPVGALRRVPAVGRRLTLSLPLAGSAGLTALAGLCQVGKSHLPARLGSYGSLALLVLALLLATPLLAATVARLLQPAGRRVLGLPERLALDNLVRHPGRTGTVVTALAAGVALLLQTSGLIHSNEDAVRAWVDECFTGDLFITSGGPLSASGQTMPMAEAVARRLEQLAPEARLVPMRLRYLDWQQSGRSTRILLLALDAGGYAAANAGRRPRPPGWDLYRRLPEPGTALVSENFAALYGVRPGDPLVLPGCDGPVTLRVAGAVTDYSYSRGTVLVDRALYRRAFDADLIDLFEVYLPPSADPERVRRRLLESPLGAEQALFVSTRDEVRGHILGMIGQLYGLASSQELVVALVAVLGMLAALLISVLQRRREVGLLRAVGATRSQVARSVLAEAVFMAAVGTGVGLLVGLPLEWYTVRVLLFEESGFLCPVHFPWAAAGGLAVLALLSAAPAGLMAAWNAVRPDVARAIAYE